jgi:hypothetical protein
METRCRVLGAKHPDTLISMVNLAQTQKLQGQDDKALTLMQNGVKLLLENLGSRHPYVTDSVGILDEWQS